MLKQVPSAREWLPQALAGLFFAEFFSYLTRPLVLCSSLTQDVATSGVVQCPIEQIGQSILVDVLRGVPISQVVAQDRVEQAAGLGRWSMWVAAIIALAKLIWREQMLKYVLHG